MSMFNIFSSTKDFEYPPLDPSQSVFRLIRLLPPKPSVVPGAYGTVRIEIIDSDAEPNLVYNALSYTWNVPAGAPPPDRRIIVEVKNGSRELRIYRPLEVALLHLCGGTDIAHRLPLFVDQICINQDDPDEKSHQVKLMRDIYANCARTIVWLGPATRMSDRWFDYLTEIYHEGVLGRVMGPHVGHFMNVFDAVMDPSFQVNEEERQDRDDLLDMIRRFGPRFPLREYTHVLDRPWFNRLWIIQEACLAPLVVFVCGTKSLCFDCFRSAGLFFYLYNTHWIKNLKRPVSQRELRQRNSLFDKTAQVSRIFQERKAIHQQGKKQGLYDLVLKYNVNEERKKIGASLQEDRIFGLLGLAADNDWLRQRVRVRYKQVARVYAEVTALMMEENIDALLFTQFPKEKGNHASRIPKLLQVLPTNSQEPPPPPPPKTQELLPSWVPDWSMDLVIPVGYSKLKEAVFSAGGPKDGSRFSLDATSLQLTIRGSVIDKIVCVGDRSYRADPQKQVFEQIDYRWAKLFFDQVSQFVREAALSPTTPHDGMDPTPEEVEVEEAHMETCLRVCDSGLSHRHFTQQLGPQAGIARLSALHAGIAQLGQRLLHADETIAAYHITRVYRTIGITPWYWQPLPAMDRLRPCANPVLASKTLFLALRDFLTDVIGLCIASARVTFAAQYIRFRRRFYRLNLHPPAESVTRAGIDPNVAFGPDMNTFTTNLLKNKGRKVYRTEAGYVGIGPARIQPGDLVVVFHGGTTAHVVREVKAMDPSSSAAESLFVPKYEYLGESYCDGFMDGQVLVAMEAHCERDFTLV